MAAVWVGTRSLAHCGALQAVVCGAGHNLRSILETLRLLCSHLGFDLHALTTATGLTFMLRRIELD